ncbi:hypothetical protein MHYP_G00355910 [Metynnis hypsauchen]
MRSYLEDLEAENCLLKSTVFNMKTEMLNERDNWRAEKEEMMREKELVEGMAMLAMRLRDLEIEKRRCIVPLEMALCLKVFIQSKYFTLEELNRSIKEFPYKWSDKADAPQLVPVNFAARKSVGGNGHKNWTLLRLLPLMVGSKIPEGDPTWEVILVLKDIVELAVSQIHTEETICYLDSKISEHRHRFFQAFPEEKLVPKHHFLEHYPDLIRAYGPLVSLWTMRFEAKHSFFKRPVMSSDVRPSLQATTLSKVDILVC